MSEKHDLLAWNWQRKEWPKFRWESEALAAAEAKFPLQSGFLLGARRHVGADEQEGLLVELISGEAMKTSEIEGEFLDRASVQSSIQRNFGLRADKRRVPAAEKGIADMMVDLYRGFNKPLTHVGMHRWHKMLLGGRRDLKDIGRYRTHKEAMQVVSGRLDRPKVHFEAPPSRAMKKEMAAYLAWWKASAPGGAAPLPPLTRAGVAHLYFVSIHPYEDGNGRIGRALVEKSLAMHLGAPTLIALSETIHRKRKAYYDALQRNSRECEITDWLVYFADVVLTAQARSLRLVEFLIDKTRLHDRLRGRLNPRQEKVLARMFREGADGFKGGLSAENYIRITSASRATASRDLGDLVEKGALRRVGEKKSTRYYLRVGSS